MLNRGALTQQSRALRMNGTPRAALERKTAQLSAQKKPHDERGY
jgi:hypothetical protein